MAARPSIDLSGWLEEQLVQASPDLLRGMVRTFAEALMGAEADAVCGAPYGERSSERVNKRNGYRAFLLGRRLVIWGGSTVVAEHICPPPIPGQPICDSWAETAPHHDGWMILLPK